MTVYLAADHRGYELKEAMQRFAEQQGHAALDITPELEQGDDYPIVAQRLVDALPGGDARAIVACGSGAGIAIALNRFRGVRAAMGMSPAHVASARNDDDINVLVLAADFVSEEDARAMAEAFLAAPFSGEERHARRVEELDRLA